MASEVMRSPSLMVLLLSLLVCVRALPFEKLVELPLMGLNRNSTDIPFDAVHYKEYLTKLKCRNIEILHAGVKIPEIATGTIYRTKHNSSSPRPLPDIPPSLPPLLSTTTAPTAQQTKAPNTSKQTTNVPKGVTRQTAKVPTSTTQPTTGIPATANPTRKVPEIKQTNSELFQDNIHIFAEYDEDVHQKLPELNKTQSNGADESVLLSGSADNNNTPANATEECTAPLSTEWDTYNWYQILLDNGGPPGGFLQKGFKTNLTRVVDPCSRPVQPFPSSTVKTRFIFTHGEFEKVYRTEEVQVRFSGTPHEFLDVSGELIWSPPDSKRRYFHMSYRKDDTGLYLSLNRNQRCVFQRDPVMRVECEYTTLDCSCDSHGKEYCIDPTSLLQPVLGNLPSGLGETLVGGGR